MLRVARGDVIHLARQLEKEPTAQDIVDSVMEDELTPDADEIDGSVHIVLRMFGTFSSNRTRETTLRHLQSWIAKMCRCSRSYDGDIDQQTLIATNETKITTLRIM